MGKTLILAAFPELYAILTVAATFLITSIMGDPVVVEAATEAAKAVAENAQTVAETAAAAL
jgi:hypothetical protein